MKVRVVIAKRRMKALAGATISYARPLKLWYVVCYNVTDDIVHPFGASPHNTLDEAIAEACEMLKVKPEDIVEVDKSDVGKYILENARNKWYPSKYKRSQTDNKSEQKIICMKKESNDL